MRLIEAVRGLFAEPRRCPHRRVGVQLWCEPYASKAGVVPGWYKFCVNCNARLDFAAPHTIARLALGENGHELIADLRPWREEKAAAEAIFREANPQIGEWCAWIHHEVAFEKLEEPWQNRFDYIASEKPEDERGWRFRLIRPASLENVLAAIRAIGGRV